MWLCSGDSKGAEDNTRMTKHGLESVKFMVKSSFHALLAEDEEAETGLTD